MILHLGVVDSPYATPPRSPKAMLAGAKGHNNSPAQKTTGDVAEILEDKYHVMEVFFEDLGVDLITKALEHSLAGAIEDIQRGAPAGGVKFSAEAEGEMETAFRLFLSQQELDGVMPGVPTKAALRGVNHRMAHPYARRGPRPSFIDTGLYEASFRAWLDGGS